MRITMHFVRNVTLLSSSKINYFLNVFLTVSDENKVDLAEINSASFRHDLFRVLAALSYLCHMTNLIAFVCDIHLPKKLLFRFDDNFIQTCIQSFYSHPQWISVQRTWKRRFLQQSGQALLEHTLFVYFKSRRSKNFEHQRANQKFGCSIESKLQFCRYFVSSFQMTSSVCIVFYYPGMLISKLATLCTKKFMRVWPAETNPVSLAILCLPTSITICPKLARRLITISLKTIFPTWSSCLKPVIRWVDLKARATLKCLFSSYQLRT